MKATKKADLVGKCYYCSGSVLTTDNYTALLQKPKGHEVMAVAHADWTGCQKATHRKGYSDTYANWWLEPKDIATDGLLTSSL